MELIKLSKELGLGIQAIKKELNDIGFKDAKKLRPKTDLPDEVCNELREIFEKPVVEVKKKTTKTWNPARILDIPAKFKDPHFTYRFCSKDREGNIRKKLAEGWVIDEELSKQINQMMPKTLQDGSKLDNTLQVRGLILMKIPKEMAEARNKFYADKTKALVDGQKASLGGEVEGRVFGEVQESHGG